MRTKGNEALRTLIDEEGKVLEIMGALRDKVGTGEEERRLGTFSQLSNWGLTQSTPHK
jgi:hypothetical protein